MNLLFSLLQAGAPGGAGWMQLLPLVGIFVIFYFFMIRPQQQRVKKEKAFREALKKGDRVVTIGGLHGRVVSLDETTVLLEVDERTKLRFERSAIRDYVSPPKVQTAEPAETAA